MRTLTNETINQYFNEFKQIVNNYIIQYNGQER